MSEIQLGDKVEDKISGYIGVVTTIGYHISGCTRYGLRSTERHNESRHFFYGDQLTVLSEEEVDRSDAITDYEYQLGERVLEKISGDSGIVVVVNTHLYNCPTYKVTEDGKESDWFDEVQLEETSGGQDYVDEFSKLSEKSEEETGSCEDSYNRSLCK